MTGLCSLFLGLVCLCCLLLGLGFTTTSGNYWFTIFNDYAATFSLLFIVLFEVIIVSYIYGIKRFVRALFLCNTQYCDFNYLANRSIKFFIPYYRFEKDIEDMLGHAPNIYWKIMWRAVSPLLLIALLIYYIVNYIMGGTVTYQAWVKENVSWMLLL